MAWTAWTLATWIFLPHVSDMLNLRSFRDYPEVFRDGLEAEVLSDRELELLLHPEIRSRQQAWVLGRLAAKELVQRYFDDRSAIVPGARQISVLPVPGKSPSVVVDVPELSGVRLAVSLSYCDSYAFAALREGGQGHRFAAVIDRVEPTYPFFDDSLLTEDEVSRVRHEEPTTQHQMLTAFGALKKAVAKALAMTEPGTASLIEVLAVKPGGEAELRYDPALFGGDARPVVRGRAWFYDDYVLAFAGLWRDKAAAPPVMARIEEDPILPDARYTEWSR